MFLETVFPLNFWISINTFIWYMLKVLKYIKNLWHAKKKCLVKFFKLLLIARNCVIIATTTIISFYSEEWWSISDETCELHWNSKKSKKVKTKLQCLGTFVILTRAILGRDLSQNKRTLNWSKDVDYSVQHFLESSKNSWLVRTW